MTGKKHVERVINSAPIDQTGEVATVSIGDSLMMSLNINGDNTADYALDVSSNGDTWFDAEETYTGTDIRDAFDITDRYVRLRVTSAATADSTADITIQGVR